MKRHKRAGEWIWICPVFGCTVKCWDRSTSTPADSETRQARTEAHAVFDRLWVCGRMSREQAYRVLQGIMGLEPQEAHIGMFDKDQCSRLVEALQGFDPGTPGAARRRKAC